MTPQLKPGALWRHPLAVSLYLLLIIWLILPLIPEESGLRFGFGYQVFFTVMVIAGGLFFMLLGRESLSVPTSTGGVLFSILVVYLATVGILTLSGTVYPFPQFKIPQPGAVKKAAQSQIERGQALFFGEENLQPQCALCHKVGGKGGERGPALDDVAQVAGTRLPGVSAADYLRNHILKGSAYFTVPGFAPIMPPFEGRLSEEQLAALVAFLLKTEAAPAAAAGPTTAPAPTATAAPSPTTAPAAATVPTKAPAATTTALTVDTKVVEAAVNKAGCGACHVIPGSAGAQGKIGPDLSQIGKMAEEHLKSGEYKGKARTALEYIRESIVEPDAYVAHACPTGPCPKGAMPPTLAQMLSPAELDALVEYLSSLK